MMKKPTFDPGFTQQVSGELSRAINLDGSFNVRRRAAGLRGFHPYLYFVNVSWLAFFAMIFLSYFVANVAFALIYTMLGPGAIQGTDATTSWDMFLAAFFF